LLVELITESVKTPITQQWHENHEPRLDAFPFFKARKGEPLALLQVDGRAPKTNPKNREIFRFHSAILGHKNPNISIISVYIRHIPTFWVTAVPNRHATTAGPALPCHARCEPRAEVQLDWQSPVVFAEETNPFSNQGTASTSPASHRIQRMSDSVTPGIYVSKCPKFSTFQEFFDEEKTAPGRRRGKDPMKTLRFLEAFCNT